MAPQAKEIGDILKQNGCEILCFFPKEAQSARIRILKEISAYLIDLLKTERENIKKPQYIQTTQWFATIHNRIDILTNEKNIDIMSCKFKKSESYIGNPSERGTLQIMRRVRKMRQIRQTSGGLEKADQGNAAWSRMLHA